MARSGSVTRRIGRRRSCSVASRMNSPLSGPGWYSGRPANMPLSNRKVVRRVAAMQRLRAGAEPIPAVSFHDERPALPAPLHTGGGERIQHRLGDAGAQKSVDPAGRPRPMAAEDRRAVGDGFISRKADGSRAMRRRFGKRVSLLTFGRFQQFLPRPAAFRQQHFQPRLVALADPLAKRFEPSKYIPRAPPSTWTRLVKRMSVIISKFEAARRVVSRKPGPTSAAADGSRQAVCARATATRCGRWLVLATRLSCSAAPSSIGMRTQRLGQAAAGRKRLAVNRSGSGVRTNGAFYKARIGKTDTLHLAPADRMASDCRVYRTQSLPLPAQYRSLLTQYQ